jgi:hypothetical protein
LKPSDAADCGAFTANKMDGLRGLPGGVANAGRADLPIDRPKEFFDRKRVFQLREQRFSYREIARHSE